MHGFNTNRILPVFQIGNYWSATVPPANVYIDAASMTPGTDFFASLDQGQRTMTVGFNRSITSNSTVYIGNNPLGQTNLTAMPQMYWGQATVGTAPHVWVKNFSGNYFGGTTAGNFFFDWKMTNSAGVASGTKNGEMWYFASSVTSPNARLDTTSNTNLIPGYDVTNSSWGVISFNLNGTSARSTQYIAHSFTYSLAESSSVRVRVNLDKRVSLHTDSFYIYTRWTIYPTGQIFRWDSIPYMSHSANVNAVWCGYELDSLWNGSPSVIASAPKSKLRAGATSTTMPDYVVAMTAFRNSGGLVALPFIKDTITLNVQTDRVGPEFTDATTAGNTIWNQVPVQTAVYLDMQRDPINAAYIDTAGCSVQHWQYGADATRSALTILNGNGTLQKHTWGDIDTNGYSEGEGAYVIQANNNTVQFTVLSNNGGTNDTSCRINPAFRITSYTAPDVPQYVMVGTSLQTPGYGYNVYQNKNAQELVLQLNQTICTNTNVFISYDRTLAVTMDRFNAYSGDCNDTLIWRTESENENLGFFLYRRVKPSFMDSLIRKGMASSTADTTANGAVYCLRKQLVSQQDTNWTIVNINGLVSGAPQGKSYGPRNYRFVDFRVYNDIRYEYRIEAVDYKLMHSLYKDYAEVMPQRMLPKIFELSGNFPNPFRAMTMIRFSLPVKTKVNLCVYNLEGRLVRRILDNEKRDAGFYRVGWDGRDDHSRVVASGPYIYRMTTPSFVKARVMILAR
jgi:hypothetical protein